VVTVVCDAKAMPGIANCPSAKNISILAEWLCQSERAPSEQSETPRWRITPRPASIPREALHIALRSPFRRVFSLCRSPMLNTHSGIVANCDHTSEWVHWVHVRIGIAMGSVSNGSSFGPGRYYRSVWQRPYPIKNRRFFKRTITLRPQILIREYSVWYVKYAALHGASFGRLRFSISLNLSKRQPKNLVFTPKMTIISKPRAEF